MSIKGTKTEQNLLKSFAGESQARSRYTFFASVAKKEGYEQIAGVFMETAEQEKEHAKKFFNAGIRNDVWFIQFPYSHSCENHEYPGSDRSGREPFSSV